MLQRFFIQIFAGALMSGSYVTYDWMQRLSRSLIRFETQDIKTQPLFNHNFSLDFFPFNNWLNSWRRLLFSFRFTSQTLQPSPSLFSYSMEGLTGWELFMQELVCYGQDTSRQSFSFY